MASSIAQKFKDVILTGDPDMSSRLLICLIGGNVYLVATALKAYEIHAGLIEHRQLGMLLCVLMMLMTPMYYALIRSGYSRRFAEPSLTMAQMLTGVTMTAFSYAISDSQRQLSLMVMQMLLMFGIFNLSPRRAWQALAYMVLLMAMTMSLMSLLRPEHYPARIEAIHFLISVALLSASAMLTGQLARLRVRLQSKTRDLEQALERIRQMAIRDEPTGTYNRRHMMELLDFFLKRQKRSGSRFSVVMLDLDHFKQVNDRYGPDIGDEALRGFAKKAMASFRETDIVSRWGGEEFLVLLPETRGPIALSCAERLHKAMAALEVTASVPELRLSFSAGIAESVDGDVIARLVSRAEKALDEAKSKGRNRIVAA